MDNKEIAKKFSLLGKLMELHGESAFKYKSYNNAYLTLRKWPKALTELDDEGLSQIPGIGKAISSKIRELINTGEIQILSNFRDKTPEGIIKMLGIKGFGPKKIALIWQELKIETIGELLNAINDEKLVSLKGFGAKTQASLKEQLEYFIESDNKLHYSIAEKIGEALINLMRAAFKDEQFHITGALYRKCQIIDLIEVITTVSNEALTSFLKDHSDFISSENMWFFKNCKVAFLETDQKSFYLDLVKTSCTTTFFEKLKISDKKTYISEEAVFEENNHDFIIPEFRETENADLIPNLNASIIVGFQDIRGCIHNHSTYSDGMNSIAEMADAAEDEGYEYLVMTDHSKSAFYANGLQEDRLFKQLDEIREEDQNRRDFKIFTGIESDILNNGDLDYPDEVLAELDVVIASIHSNLKMDIDKATNRLIRAIENPFTSILGHPTGRILLSRKGYPVDFKKIIDACSANNVAIEINANPLRLDIDWRHLDYAMQKDILISINPDAHSIKGIKDTYYGICVARKAGLPVNSCLNAFDLEQFEEWLVEQHEKRA